MATFGADPELFVTRGRTIIPACGLFGGTKGAPIPLEGMSEGFGLQEDNVMLEFNIPPSTSWRTASRNVASAMAYIEKNVLMPQGLRVARNICSADFKEEDLLLPGARVLGCSADNNAYNAGQYHPRYNAEVLGTFRGCGGHIHIGLDTDIPKPILAQFADLFIGLNLVQYDKQGARRNYYGTPGRYRETSYGIEYRTPSNLWLFSEGKRNLVFQCADRMARAVENNPESLSRLYPEVPWPDVQAAISMENEGLAMDLLGHLENLKWGM